jgi:DsbC/DsbD-like thiol-disulfide interchange protein
MRILLLLIVFPLFQASAQTGFDTRIAGAVAKLQCTEPDEENPVTLNAQVIMEKDSIAVIVKSRLATGWHIYDYVPSSLPYIPIEHILQLPDGIRAVGAWKKTESSPSAADPGVLIFEKEAVFIHKAVKLPGAKISGAIKAGLYYQTCDLNQCLPPVEKLIELKISSTNFLQ